MKENLLRLLAEQRAIEEIHLESLKKELGSRKVRILNATLILTSGGVEKSLFHLIRGLDRHCFEPEIYTRYGGKWESVFEQYCNVSVHKGDDIIDLADREGFNIIHIHNFNGLYQLAPEKVLIETVYGIAGIFLMDIDKTKLGRLIYCDERCKNFFTPIVISNPLKTMVINNPVNVDHKPIKGKLRKLLKIPQNKKLIGWVGRISPEKNVDLFLDTANKMGNQYEWVVIGEGWKPEINLEFIKKLEKLDFNIHWIRNVDPFEIMDYVADMDLLTLTSWTEGQSIALLEAMVVKTPVICTNVGGLPSVVLEGETGFMINRHTPENMAGVIRKSLRYGKDLIEQAYSHVYFNFNAVDYVRKMEIIYLEEYFDKNFNEEKKMAKEK